MCLMPVVCKNPLDLKTKYPMLYDPKFISPCRCSPFCWMNVKQHQVMSYYFFFQKLKQWDLQEHKGSPLNKVKWIFVGSPTCEKHAIYSEQLYLVLLLVSLSSILISEPTHRELLFSPNRMIINNQQSVQTQTSNKITVLSKKHRAAPSRRML